MSDIVKTWYEKNKEHPNVQKHMPYMMQYRDDFPMPLGGMGTVLV